MERERTTEVLTKADELPQEIKDLIYSKHFLESNKPERERRLQFLIDQMTVSDDRRHLYTMNLNRMQRIIANANVLARPYHYLMLGPEMRQMRQAIELERRQYEQIRPVFEIERERYRQAEMEQKRGQRY